MKKIILTLATLLSSVSIFAQSGDTHGVILPEADELHIQSTDKSVPASSKNCYMKIVLDRKIEAGKWTLIIFPTVLDGYYFGVNAERYKVTEYDLNTSPVTVKREEMAGLDDFEANQMYLVKSEADLEGIVAMSPGAETKVPATPSGVTLMCLTLNDEPTAVQSVKATSPNTENQTYDLSGRLSKLVRSGIYIVNGKKVFAK